MLNKYNAVLDLYLLDLVACIYQWYMFHNLNILCTSLLLHI